MGLSSFNHIAEQFRAMGLFLTLQCHADKAPSNVVTFLLFVSGSFRSLSNRPAWAASRQWSEVFDSYHTFFARCVSQKTHGHARIAREMRAIDSCNMQKHATKSDSSESGHCLAARPVSALLAGQPVLGAAWTD